MDTPAGPHGNPSVPHEVTILGVYSHPPRMGCGVRRGDAKGLRPTFGCGASCLLRLLLLKFFTQLRLNRGTPFWVNIRRDFLHIHFNHRYVRAI